MTRGCRPLLPRPRRPSAPRASLRSSSSAARGSCALSSRRPSRRSRFAGAVPARGRGPGHAESGEGDAARRAAASRGGRRRSRRSCKDGAVVKAGDTIVEFDPYDARREEARRAGRPRRPRTRRIDKARADGTKNERSLALDQDLAREDLERAQTFTLTDERLYSRQKIIESRLDRELAVDEGRRVGQEARGERRALARPERCARRDRRREGAGSSSRSPRRASSRCASSRRTTGSSCSSAPGAARRRSSATRCGRGRRSPSCPTSRSSRRRCSCSRPTAAGLKPGLSARVAIEGRPGEAYEATVSKVDPLAKTARLAVAGEVLRDGAVAGAHRPRGHEAGPARAGDRPPRGGAGRPRRPARGGVRQGRQARRLPARGRRASCRSR